MSLNWFLFHNAVHAEVLTEVSVYSASGDLLERSIGFRSHRCTYLEGAYLLGLISGLNVVERVLL